MNSKKEITIIGATGNIGSVVAKNLINRGYDVKAIVRNIEKASIIFKDTPTIKIEKADLKDVSDLKSALKGTKYLYLNLSTQTTHLDIPFAPDREGVANILNAIDRKSIKQIISISGLGAIDNMQSPGKFNFIPNIIRKQGHKLIKESGIPYTILHCSWFIDSFIFYKRKNAYTIIGDTENPIYFTNCDDFSSYIENAIENPNAFFREFPIQGTEGYKHPEAARQFFSIYDNTTKINFLPSRLIAFMALFNNEFKTLKHMSDYFSKSTETFMADELETYSILGKPKISLKDYAHKIKDEVKSGLQLY